MTELEFIEKRSKWKYRLYGGICNYCGKVQEYNETFRGVNWNHVEKEMGEAAAKYGSLFFGYVCEDCHYDLTGIDCRGMTVGDHLHKLNKKRREGSHGDEV